MESGNWHEESGKVWQEFVLELFYSVITCKHLKSNIKKLLNKEQVGELGFSTTNAVITLYAQVEIVKWFSSGDNFIKFIF